MYGSSSLGIHILTGNWDVPHRQWGCASPGMNILTGHAHSFYRVIDGCLINLTYQHRGDTDRINLKFRASFDNAKLQKCEIFKWLMLLIKKIENIP